jgi:hypothetical protein
VNDPTGLTTQASAAPPRGGGRSVVPVAILVFALAFLVRVVSVADSLTFDEFYHVLAAQSWIERGTLAIADGSPYDRARAFTWAVAASMRLFGETLVAARIPSVVFGSLWVTLVFVWVRRAAGGWAAWVAALLLCFDPHAIGLSQIARMYSMHGLFFWLGAAIVFEVVTDGSSNRERLFSAAAAGAAFALAFHLQIVTVIGLASLAAWPVLRILVKRIGESRRNRFKLSAAVMAGLLLGSLLSTMDVGTELLLRYHSVNARQSLLDLDPRYYFWWLASTYPVLLALLPFAILVGMRRNRSLTLYCASFFAIAFVLHSAAASKQVRYLHYALPAVFIIWGLAAAELMPRVINLATEASVTLSRAVRIVPVAVARAGILAGAALFLVATSPSVPEAVRLIVPGLARPSYGTNYWRKVERRLDPLVARERIVVSTVIPQTLFFLGRGDVEVGLNFRRGPMAPDFSDDWRLGVPVITTLPALEALVRCNESGLLVVHQPYWRRPWGVTSGMADFAEETMTRVAVGDVRGELRAYQWERPKGTTPTDACKPFRPPFHQPSPGAAGS